MPRGTGCMCGWCFKHSAEIASRFWIMAAASKTTAKRRQLFLAQQRVNSDNSSRLARGGKGEMKSRSLGR